jgi:DNA-binding NarL/FixJ family response regulator
MVNILLVDDEPRLLRAWCSLFSDQPGFRLVGTLMCADELARTAEETAPHVVVLDLSMPGLPPLEAIRRLADSSPDVRVIVYSAHNDRGLIQAAFDAGAWGYVDKMANPEDMFSAVRRVAAGEAVVPRGLAG